MTYKGSYSFHLPKDMNEKRMFDEIASGVRRKVKLRERKGLVGVMNPFQNDNVIKWIEEVGLDSKEKFILESDKIHRHYSWYLYDYAYIKIWNDRIRKTDNIALDETQENCNTCRFTKKSKGVLFCKKHKKETIENEKCKKFKNNLLNEYYMREIIYLDGTGWIIAENDKNIKDYKNQRESKLLGQTDVLEKRCEDATRYLQQLKEHQTPESLSPSDKDREIA